jgi:hypothetical protein
MRINAIGHLPGEMKSICKGMDRALPGWHLLAGRLKPAVIAAITQRGASHGNRASARS